MEPRERSFFDNENAKPFLLEGGSEGVVLLHGFTGSVSHMRPIGNGLNKLGYTTMGINLPGHATTEDDMAKTGWQDWLQAAKEAVLTLEKQCETVSVCGLSMGGVLSLLIAEQRPVHAVIPISAPMGVRNPMARHPGLIAPFMKRIAWGGGPDSARARAVDPAYDFGYTGFPSRKAIDLNKLIALCRRNLFNVTCPVLAIQSHGDETITPDSLEVILNGVRSDVRESLWLEDVPHACTITKETPHIIAQIDAFLRENRGARQPLV